MRYASFSPPLTIQPFSWLFQDQPQIRHSTQLADSPNYSGLERPPISSRSPNPRRFAAFPALAIFSNQPKCLIDHSNAIYDLCICLLVLDRDLLFSERLLPLPNLWYAGHKREDWAIPVQWYCDVDSECCFKGRVPLGKRIGWRDCRRESERGVRWHEAPGGFGEQRLEELA